MKPVYSIGFDIGGTRLRAVLWNGRRVVSSVVCRTPGTLKSFVSTVQNVLTKLIPPNTILAGVGIGIAGFIQGTTLVRSRNLKHLGGLNLRQVIPADIKLRVDNDARAFLRGLPGLSTRYRKQRVLGITLGTGIGRALAVNGKIRPLKSFEHSEPWEPEYQKRRFEPSHKFAIYLSSHLAPLIKLRRANILLIGGGVVEQKTGLVQELKISFKKVSLGCKIEYIASDALQAARGAAILVSGN